MKRPLVWFAVVFVTVLFLLESFNYAIYTDNPIITPDSGEKSLSGYAQGESVRICGTVKDYSYNNQYGQISTELILKNIQILPDNREDPNDKNTSISQKYSKENPKYEKTLQNDGDNIAESVNNTLNFMQKNHSVIVYLTGKTRINIGSVIILEGELNLWNLATNPGEFDAEKYYGNRYVLFSVKNAKALQISTKHNRVLQRLKEFRLKQEELLENNLSAGNAAVLKAMLFGNKKEIEEEIKNLYQNNGIAHILAISGLHISLLGMTIYRLLQNLPLPKWLMLTLSEIFLILYGSMVGFSASTFRAIFMFTIFLLSIVLKRSYDMMTAMVFSAITWLVFHPRYLFDCGFQLSYGAIVGIGYLLPILQTMAETVKSKFIRKGITFLLPSLSVTLITAPILIHHYYELSFFSILLNIIVLPLMAPLLLSAVGLLSAANAFLICSMGSIVGSIWMVLAQVFAFPINAILRIYELGCRGLELLPIGRKNLAPLSAGELILYYGLLFIMTILVKRKKHPYQFVFALASIFILLFPKTLGFSVWVLDVGQGDCNVIFTREGDCFVIDCGSTSKKNVGEKVLIPFLKYHGINRVDGIIITHPDEDHMNGIVNLLETGQEENIEITCIYIYEKGIENELTEWEEMLVLARKQKIPLWGIGQGDILQTESFFMECIYPLAGQEGLTGNEASLVMKVECGDFRGLFTGDLETEGEQKLLEFYRNQMCEEGTVIGLKDTEETLFGENTYNFLKVGHHGSSGSGSETFLQWVNPDYAVISCGKDNRYGHPHVETLERLKENRISYGITYKEGAFCYKAKTPPLSNFINILHPKLQSDR